MRCHLHRRLLMAASWVVSVLALGGAQRVAAAAAATPPRRRTGNPPRVARFRSLSCRTNPKLHLANVSDPYCFSANTQFLTYLMWRPLYFFGNGQSPSLNPSFSLANVRSTRIMTRPSRSRSSPTNGQTGSRSRAAADVQFTGRTS